jgi:hypothetical protein
LFTPNGLYAVAVNFGLCFLSGVGWVAVKHGRLLVDLLKTNRAPDSEFSWRNEVWPFQWKVAVSWTAGFFTTFFFVPVLYRTSGAVEAGRMGMMVQILLAISGLAVCWLTTKAPTFGKLVSVGSYAELDHLFAISARRMLAVAVAGGALFLAAVWGVSQLGLPIASRILPPVTTAVLVAAMIANCVFSAQVIYLRSYCEEPLLVLSVAMGAAIAVLTVLTAPRYGSLGVSLSYLASLLVLGVAGGARVFRSKRKEWQRPGATHHRYPSLILPECDFP